MWTLQRFAFLLSTIMGLNEKTQAALIDHFEISCSVCTLTGHVQNQDNKLFTVTTRDECCNKCTEYSSCSAAYFSSMISTCLLKDCVDNAGGGGSTVTNFNSNTQITSTDALSGSSTSAGSPVTAGNTQPGNQSVTYTPISSAESAASAGSTQPGNQAVTYTPESSTGSPVSAGNTQPGNQSVTYTPMSSAESAASAGSTQPGNQAVTYTPGSSTGSPVSAGNTQSGNQPVVYTPMSSAGSSTPTGSSVSTRSTESESQTSAAPNNKITTDMATKSTVKPVYLPIFLLPCQCSTGAFIGKTNDEIIAEIVADIKIDKTITSSHLRKLVSVLDSRSPTMAIGSVGIIVFAIVFGLFFSIDSIRFYEWIRINIRNKEKDATL